MGGQTEEQRPTCPEHPRAALRLDQRTGRLYCPVCASRQAILRAERRRMRKRH